MTRSSIKTVGLRDEPKDITESFKMLVPKSLKKSVTPELMARIRDLGNNEEVRTLYKDNILRYIDVLNDNKTKVSIYVDACIFVAFKVQFGSNIKAYAATFPDRYARYVKKDPSKKLIHKIVNIYKSGQIVQKIIEQSLVPSYIVNADLNAAAISKMAELMGTARSEVVQLNSAIALEAATAMPKELRIQQEVTHKADDNIVDVYKEALLMASREKRKMIEEGMDAKEVANISLTKVVDAEIDE